MNDKKMVADKDFEAYTKKMQEMMSQTTQNMYQMSEMMGQMYKQKSEK